MSYSYAAPVKAGFPRPHLDAFDPRKRRRYRSHRDRKRAYYVLGRARRSIERSAHDVDASAYSVSTRALKATARLLVDGAQRVGEHEGTLLAPVYELTHPLLGEWFAHRADLSRRTFRRCLDALARAGLIVYRPGKGSRPSVVGLPVLVELGGAKCVRWLARFLASSRAKLRGHRRGDKRARSPVARALVERATGHQADGPCSRIDSPECSLAEGPSVDELRELSELRTERDELRAQCVYSQCAAERHAPAADHSPHCPEHREAETAEEEAHALRHLEAMKAAAGARAERGAQPRPDKMAIRGRSKPSRNSNSTYVVGGDTEATPKRARTARGIFESLRSWVRPSDESAKASEAGLHAERGSGRETCERCADVGTLPAIGTTPGRTCPDCCSKAEVPPLMLLQPSAPQPTEAPGGVG